MAKLYSCDRCRVQIESTDEDRREWSSVSIHKLESAGVFQQVDICIPCSNGLRRWLQAGANPGEG